MKSSATFEVLELLEPGEVGSCVRAEHRYGADDLDSAIEFARGLSVPHDIAMWRKTADFESDLARLMEYKAEAQALWPESIRSCLLVGVM